MQTVLLQSHLPKGYGGKPMDIGRLFASNNLECCGYFLGYLQDGKKVMVKKRELEALVEKLEEGPKKTKRSGLVRLLRKILPESVKMELAVI